MKTVEGRIGAAMSGPSVGTPVPAVTYLDNTPGLIVGCDWWNS